MTGTRQGGSVLNFIIVAVVIAGLLAAGIYVVRQMTQNSSPDGGIAATEENSEQAQESQPPKEAETKEQPSQVSPGDSASTTEELPQTGPVESVGGALVLGTLSLMVMYYLRSRRIDQAL